MRAERQMRAWMVLLLVCGCAEPPVPRSFEDGSVVREDGAPSAGEDAAERDTAVATDAAEPWDAAVATDAAEPWDAVVREDAPLLDTGSVTEPDAGTGCTFDSEPRVLLTYASVGDADNARLLADACEYQLVVGDKRTAPAGRITSAANRARGARSGYVMGGNGEQIRTWLREDGIEATAARMRSRLAAGYDYLVIDEITADPEWADSHEISRRFRRVLDELPEATVIAYVSIDLTQYAGGAERLRERQWLMRALQRRGHRIALEVYLHTGEVIRGDAPAAFREAARRLSAAVSGLADADVIQRSAFTVLGLSINSDYARYRYLDSPSSDLSALRTEVRALDDDARLRQQRGLGYYFVNRSDITPSSAHPYDIDDLIDAMGAAARTHLSAVP